MKAKAYTAKGEARSTDVELPEPLFDGTVRFDSILSLVGTERACAWTLGGLLDDTQFDRLGAAAEESLQPFLTREGQVAFGMPALIITCAKP